MADKKISELTNIIGADLSDDDEFVVVDTSAAETKAITYAELKKINGDLTVSGTVDGRDLSVDGAKLDGIESGATGDQAASEVPYTNTTSGLTATNVQAAVDEVEGRVDTLESVSHTHANKAVLDATTASFTTADETKLDGIETNADVTDTANVTAAGALMDSELTNINAVKALDQGVATTDSPSFAGVTATTADIDGGTIDGTTIGGTSAAAGTFTTATATTGNITTVNATTVDATNVEVTNIKAKDGTAAGSIADLTGIVTLASSVLTTTDINGGTIDGVTIGGTTPGAVTTSSLVATTADINGGTIDGTTIGGTTPAAVTTSSLVATTADINGGTIDGVTIGGSSAGAITGTTITGSSFVTTGDMTFGDNDKAIFGAGSDLQIYHDGSNSYIDEVGTGSLFVRATNLNLQQADGAKSYLTAAAGGALTLRHDGSEKLSTTSTGVDVTGTVTADGLTVDGTPTSLDENRLVFNENPATGSLGSRIVWRNPGTGYDYASVGFTNEASASAGGLRFKTASSVFSDSDTLRATIASNGDISFYEDTGTTPKFFWDASAEALGIGTSSPASGLHINSTTGGGAIFSQSGYNYATVSQLISSADALFGGGVIAGSVAAQVTKTTGDAANYIRAQISEGIAFHTNITGAAGTSVARTTNERMRIDLAGNVGIGTNAPNNKAQVSYTSVAAVPSAGAGGHGFAVGDSGFGIAAGALTSGNGYLQATRWDGSATNYNLILQPNGGNVGIGTSSPYSLNGSNLEVYDASGVIARLSLHTSTGRHWAIGSVAADSALSFYDVDFSTERMRIDSSGNVAIGATSTSAKLHVQGSAPEFRLYSDTTTGSTINFIDQGWQSQIQGTAGNLLFKTGGTTERMRITSSGNVGIGTSSPDFPLHLYSAGGAAAQIEGLTRADLFLVDAGAGANLKRRVIRNIDNNLAFGREDDARLNYYEDVTITSSGNVGIGTSSPTGPLTVANSSNTLMALDADSNRGRLRLYRNGATAYTQLWHNGTDADWSATTGSLTLTAGGSERMRIDSSGNLLVGTTSAYSVSKTTIDYSSNGAFGITLRDTGTATDGAMAYFVKGGAVVGSIISTTSATSYNTSSDYRLKEDVQPMVGASDRVLSLNPVNFAWKADGSRTDGFIAHEAQAVAPYAVTGEKDGEEMQGMDHSKLVPLLTAALQEALKRIEALEAQLNP